MNKDKNRNFSQNKKYSLYDKLTGKSELEKIREKKFEPYSFESNNFQQEEHYLIRSYYLNK